MTWNLVSISPLCSNSDHVLCHLVKLSESLIYNDRICAAIDEVLMTQYNQNSSFLFFSMSMDWLCNLIVTEGWGMVHQKIYYWIVDKGLFLLFDSSQSVDRGVTQLTITVEKKQAIPPHRHLKYFACIFTLNVPFALQSALTKMHFTSTWKSEQECIVAEWVYSGLLNFIYEIFGYLSRDLSNSSCSGIFHATNAPLQLVFI